MPYQELEEIAKEKPRAALKRLKEMEPTAEVLIMMSYFYLKKKRLRKADKITVTNYLNNPDHFIVRINYADYCLRKKKSDKIPEIFKNCLTLEELYPGRKKFSVAEYRGFMVMIAYFYLAKNQREKAESAYFCAYRVDPQHPSIERLKKKLARSR